MDLDAVWVVSGVSGGMDVLDGGAHAPRGMGGFGVFDVALLVWDLPLRHWQRNVFGSCEKI